MPSAAAKVKWEWKNDKGKFEACPDDFRDKIEAAYVANGGTGKAKVNHWETDYIFDFDKLTQTNMSSKKARDVQRIGPAITAPAKAAEPEKIEWQWNDGSSWKACAADVSAKIESTYQDAKEYKLSATFGGFTYTFDLSKMAQINDSTKKERKIRRLVNGVEKGEKKKRTDDGDDDDDKPAAKSAKKEDTAVAVDHSKVKVASGGSPFHAGGSAGALTAKTKLIKKGRGVVDPLSHMQEKCHVYEAGEKVYQCMLNQTNIDQNNNKFYVIQLLESDAGGEYYVFTRWGRVGVPGQTSLDKMGSLPGAIAQYCKKFRDKTSNDWNSLPTFHKVPGKYQLMEIDFGAEDGDKAGGGKGLEEAHAAGVPPSTLPVEVQNLMRMIGNKAEMVKSMKELEIDTNKMPLGKISKKQIKEAFGHLTAIETELKKASPNMHKCTEESSMFYTLIPHDFGMATPPVIRNMDMLKRKMELLEVLSDLEVASKILAEAKAGVNPLDAGYKNLKCELTPVPKASATFKRVEEYVRNTHGKTHNAYKLSVTDVFEVNREGEEMRYKAYAGKIGNKQMLWHGSRTTNFMGILSQGLRIAPPEAPATGYMFGKAVYLASNSSKSANYCHSSPGNPEGLLLLCEAALGNQYELKAAKYMDKPPAGHDSTLGLGKMHPDPKGAVNVDGVTWPIGKSVDSGITDTVLLYPEMMVYSTSQCKMSFLVRVKFHYGK